MAEETNLIQQPFLDRTSALGLLDKYYGLKASTIIKLKSFSDQNFHIVLTEPITIGEGSCQKQWDQFTLKIFNSSDSIDGNRIDLALHTMAYLWNKGFCCPLPVVNLQGKLFHVEKMFAEESDGESAAKYGLFKVVLLTFIPGEMLSSLDPVPPEVYPDIGQKLGRIHQLLEKALAGQEPDEVHLQRLIKDLQEFNATCSGEWSLDKVSGQRELLHLVKDDDLHEAIEKVIDLFDKHIQSILPSFQKGILHGDINIDNVIVVGQKSSASQDCAVAGIIDFGEVAYTAVFFDVAIAVAEMMLAKSDDQLESTRQFLAGYSSHRKITNVEKEALYHLVLARLAQVILLSLKASEDNPTNDYIMEPVEESGIQMRKLLSMSKSDVNSVWFP